MHLWVEMAAGAVHFGTFWLHLCQLDRDNNIINNKNNNSNTNNNKKCVSIQKWT